MQLRNQVEWALHCCALLAGLEPGRHLAAKDLAAFHGGAGDEQLRADLEEAFGDPLFDEVDLTDEQLREVAATAPGVARGVLQLYRAYRSAREALDSLGAGLSGDPELEGVRLPNEEVSDLVQAASNYFPALEEAAEALARQAALEPAEVEAGLVQHLRREFLADWAVLLVDAALVAAAGDTPPAAEFLAALAAGTAASPKVADGTTGPEDVLVAPLAAHGATVLVAGDKNARYEAVLDVLDSIKQLDVKRVGLETVRKQ